MTEKNFEEFLKKAAKSYNVPPSRTPREEMWAAIQASRSARPQVVYGGGSTAPSPASKHFSTRAWMGAAAAAMLLVATGVGIGRYTAPTNPPRTSAASASLRADPIVVATADNENASARRATVGSSSNTGEVQRSRSAGERVALNERGHTKGNNDQTTPTDGVQSPSFSTPNSAYQLATMHHLSEAEALLTSFRTRSPADQQMDAQLGSWARQLLTNTRLLLDSPVANDPQRRPLLEDLELVLVQIVQLSPGSTPQDRELIEKTLQNEHVMTRLRTAIPAGAQRGS